MESGQVAPAPAIEGTETAVEAAVASSHPAPAQAEAAKMFKFSAYLHLGPGAEECEHGKDGECTDHDHFHAWCRLPNKFQHADLYRRAMAAKARLLRQLEQDGSDRREILESELDVIRGDAHVETIIDDLLKAEWAQDYVTAVKEVGEREEYEHITADRERFVELGHEAEKPEEEQSEEFRHLGQHISDWRVQVEAEMSALQEPKRQALRDMDSDQLIDQLRKLRISQLGDQMYLHTYNQYEWFMCTLGVKPHPVTGRPFERYWKDMGTPEEPTPQCMWGEAPEVIDGLEVMFDHLEKALQAGSQGNS